MFVIRMPDSLIAKALTASKKVLCPCWIISIITPPVTSIFSASVDGPKAVFVTLIVDSETLAVKSKTRDIAEEVAEAPAPEAAEESPESEEKA